MHFDACRNRVPPTLVEAALIDSVEQLKSLTQGASAAGARAHTLPEKPGDVQDDGEFHYAVLGPKAVSESGKPSAEGQAVHRRDDRPGPPARLSQRRGARRAVEGRALDAARARVREHLGWIEVRDRIKGQPIDPIREQMLAGATEAARRRVPEAIRQAWSIVVHRQRNGRRPGVQGDRRRRAAVRDRQGPTGRARIQETAISSEAMMPGGPYDLWREGEDLAPRQGSRRRLRPIPPAAEDAAAEGDPGTRSSRASGRESGSRDSRGPTGPSGTFWRTAIDEPALKDPGLEVARPEAAVLGDLDPGLLAHGGLPGLWTAEGIAVGKRHRLLRRRACGDRAQGRLRGNARHPEMRRGGGRGRDFGGRRTGTAVADQRGPRRRSSARPFPPAVLTAAATLRPPPDPVAVDALTADSIPEAWKDGRSNALAVSAALSNKHGESLPWSIVRDALDTGIRARWIALAEESAPWPCELAGARNVVLRVPSEVVDPVDKPAPKGLLVAGGALPADGIQGPGGPGPGSPQGRGGPRSRVRCACALRRRDPPEPDAVDRINALLAEVSEDWKLK